MAEFLVRAVERLKEFTGEREPDALSDLLAATTAAVRYAAECVRCLREPRSLLPRLDELKRHERSVRSAHESLATSLVRAGSDPMTSIKWTYVADQFLKTLGGYRRASSGLERIAMKQA
jgi:hypothetical protein